MDLLDSRHALGAAEPLGRLSQVGGREGTASRLPRPRAAEGGPAAGARLRLTGELEEGATAPLEDRLEHLVQAGHRSIEVDLAGVPRLPLAVLRLLLATHSRLRARGGRLVLVNPNARVQRLLAASGTGHLAGAGMPAGTSSGGGR